MQRKEGGIHLELNKLCMRKNSRDRKVNLSTLVDKGKRSHDNDVQMDKTRTQEAEVTMNICEFQTKRPHLKILNDKKAKKDTQMNF